LKVYVLITDQLGSKNTYQIGRKPRIIGRSDAAGIQIFDELASGRHCQIYINDRFEIIVKDMGSKNGTALNGVKKPNHRVFIGDTISFGNSKLQIDTKKTSKEAINKLTYEGDQRTRAQGDVTIELEDDYKPNVTGAPGGKPASNKKKVAIPGQPKLELEGGSAPKEELSKNKEERAKQQQQKLFGTAFNNAKAMEETPFDRKKLLIKHHSSNIIDYTLTFLIYTISLLAMKLIHPKEYYETFKYGGGIASLFSGIALFYTIAGLVVAIIFHRWNRKRKAGSIGEKIVGLD
jgi:pSer/pThr/pTyr-binding forkhead associated (FHA) protein